MFINVGLQVPVHRPGLEESFSKLEAKLDVVVTATPQPQVLAGAWRAMGTGAAL